MSSASNDLIEMHLQLLKWRALCRSGYSLIWVTSSQPEQALLRKKLALFQRVVCQKLQPFKKLSSSDCRTAYLILVLISAKIMHGMVRAILNVEILYRIF